MTTVTVTSTTGPGVEVTALELTEVTSVNFDFERSVLFVFQGTKLNQFALNEVTSVTFSGSGQSFTITVS